MSVSLVKRVNMTKRPRIDLLDAKAARERTAARSARTS